MYRKLSILNGLAILGVVINHAAGWGIEAMFYRTDRYLPVAVPNFDQMGSPVYYILLFMKQIASIDIPSFLFVSGFFVAFSASGGQSNISWKVVMARIKVLILPFLFWTIFRFLLIRQVPSSPGEVFQPYYYLVLIVQFYLLSPIIVPLAKNNWKLLLLISAALQLTIHTLEYIKTLGGVFIGLNHLMILTSAYYFPSFMLWFVLGIVIGSQVQIFKPWLAKFKWLLFASTLSFLFLTIIEYDTITQLAGSGFLGASFAPVYSRFFYKLAFVLTFLAFEKVSIPYSKQIAQIGNQSLGIYFMNQNANFVVAFLIYHLAPWMMGYQILYQPVLIMAGLGIPLLVLRMVSISPARQYYRYVFG